MLCKLRFNTCACKSHNIRAQLPGWSEFTVNRGDDSLSGELPNVANKCIEFP